MKYEHMPTFESYFDGAEESTRTTLDSDSEAMNAIKAYYIFFAEKFFIDKNQIQPITAFLAFQSYMLFMSGVRTSLSGHQSAIFPLFRTALEAACYAFLMEDQPDTQDVWLNRHKDEEALKKCRKIFTSAVKTTGKKIQALDFVAPGTEQWLDEAYQGSIDFGAHPNVKSLFPNLNVDDNREDNHIGIELIGLHSPGSSAYLGCIAACLDYGQIIATILTCCINPKSNELIEAIVDLNNSKEKITVETFGLDPI